jgi:D-psicose/D-tagatose/L-ribulose 3-epimerase
MKLAISNLAWQPQEETKVAETLQQLEIKGVEIAPTKVWQNPLIATKTEIDNYRRFWQKYNIEIIALQSLLFGRTDLTIFASETKRRETFDYLTKIIELGCNLGAKVLVFGSPRNRQVSNLSDREVAAIAIAFFRELGDLAAKYEMFFCIEPNPTIYDCDFINTSQQGMELVTNVNSRGFGLHLDAAGMTLSKENISVSLADCHSKLCHFHISEPYLQIIGEEDVEHELFARSLSDLNYNGWVSIEMKAQSSDNNLQSVTKALKTAIQYYKGN